MLTAQEIAEVQEICDRAAERLEKGMKYPFFEFSTLWFMQNDKMEMPKGTDEVWYDAERNMLFAENTETGALHCKYVDRTTL